MFRLWVLVVRTIRMYSNTGITKHGLGTSSGNLNALSGTFNLVTEVCEDTEFNLLLI